MCMLPMSIALPPKLYHSKQYEQIYKDDFGKRIVLILKEKKTNENKLLEPKEMHKNIFWDNNVSWLDLTHCCGYT